MAFHTQLKVRQSEAYYKIMWGKGLHQLYDTLIYYRDTYGDLGDVAIIIAGNDIQWGRDWCVAGLDKVRSLGVTVYSAIPPCSFEKAGEHPKECCPDLYRPPRRRMRFGVHVKRVHAALGCQCIECCLEAPSASTVSTVATYGHQTRRLYEFRMLLCVWTSVTLLFPYVNIISLCFMHKFPIGWSVHPQSTMLTLCLHRPTLLQTPPVLLLVTNGRGDYICFISCYVICKYKLTE